MGVRGRFVEVCEAEEECGFCGDGRLKEYLEGKWDDAKGPLISRKNSSLKKKVGRDMAWREKRKKEGNDDNHVYLLE